MVMLPVLPLRNVTNTFEVFPVCTFPKDTLGGFGITPFAVIPDPCTASSGLLLSATLPLSDPDLVGAKETLRTQLCPGDRLSGSAGLLTP